MPHTSRNTAPRMAALCAMLLAAPFAHAVSLNPHGTGQVLLYPYYTVNGGQTTLLSVVNATNKAKALRVAFRESYNGREVMGLNVYVSPYDVWTAAVFAFDNGPANLLTDDRTCTVPALRDNAALPTLPDGRRYMAFHSLAYANDSGPAGVERTREGTLEVIEMGEVVDHSPTWLATAHSIDGPINCAKVREAWAAGGYWVGNANTDITAPGGGLYGTLAIVNPAQGTIFQAGATALDGFSSYAQHTAPDNAHPDLGDARSSPAGSPTPYADADVNAGGAVVRAHYVGADRAVDAVSAVLMADSVFNEYVVEPASGAHTDWLVSFPTKRFYTDTALTAAALPPFSESFGRVTPGKSCTEFDLATFDREEGTILQGWNGGFLPVPLPALCYGTNVIPLGNTSRSGDSSISVLGSQLGYSIGISPFSSGQLFLQLDDARQPHALRPDANDLQFHGLPAIGFAVVKYINGSVAPGVLANYSAASPHHATVKCTRDTANCQ